MKAGPFVQFLALGLDRRWLFLPAEERAMEREALARALRDGGVVTTYSYSTVGLKAGTDLLLWRVSPTLEALQEGASRLLSTGLGRYLTPTRVMTGLVRPSLYTRRPTPQEQALWAGQRLRYLVVYPFTKTADWYLLGKETRQGMMNEHIRVGRRFPGVRQVLVYSFGLDDQEFVVAYETDDLAEFQALVMALRETEARRYTLGDTPIFTAIRRPLEEALALLG